MTERKPDVKPKERWLKGWHIALFFGGIVGVLVLTVGLIGVIQLALQSAKRTEEYAVAYECFLSSETWQELDLEESQIRLSSYSASANFPGSKGDVEKTAILEFRAAGETYTVVCVRENGIWRVQSTNFD